MTWKALAIAACGTLLMILGLIARVVFKVFGGRQE